MGNFPFAPRSRTIANSGRLSITILRFLPFSLTDEAETKWSASCVQRGNSFTLSPIATWPARFSVSARLSVKGDKCTRFTVAAKGVGSDTLPLLTVCCGHSCDTQANTQLRQFSARKLRATPHSVSIARTALQQRTYRVTPPLCGVTAGYPGAFPLSG